VDQVAIMRRVVELSRQGMLAGLGGPFGCVIVKGDEIVGEAHNEVVSTNDPTAHAELLAVRRASAHLRTFDLKGCDLYTNATPCCMCMSSMLWARIDRAYHILEEKDSEAIGLGDRDFYDEVGRPFDQHRILPLTRLPALRDEAWAVMKDWHEKPDKVSF
jgi:guanine deaminase